MMYRYIIYQKRIAFSIIQNFLLVVYNPLRKKYSFGIFFSMSQVSKRYLPEEKLTKIMGIFFEIVSNIFDTKEADMILSELLTPTEKIMLAKRITCFYLLIKEVPIHEIAHSIKLSTSTVSYLKHILLESPQIQDYLSNKINHEKVKNFMEDLLVEFLYGGLRKGSNWRNDKQIYYQHKRNRQQPL